MRSTKAVLFAAMLVAMATSVSHAHDPVVTITTPVDGHILYCPAFPCNGTLEFTVNHNLNLLEGLLVTRDDGVNPAVTLLHVTDPWDNQTPYCNSWTNAPTGTGICSRTDDSNGGGQVNFTYPGPGSYVFVVSTGHTAGINEFEGDDEATEHVQLQPVSVEYPAPPAVANAFLNATYTKQQLSAKRRGCIVSQIAENHAKDSKYGPKGGPYETGDIHTDAERYFLNCPS